MLPGRKYRRREFAAKIRILCKLHTLPCIKYLIVTLHAHRFWKDAQCATFSSNLVFPKWRPRSPIFVHASIVRVILPEVMCFACSLFKREGHFPNQKWGTNQSVNDQGCSYYELEDWRAGPTPRIDELWVGGGCRWKFSPEKRVTFRRTKMKNVCAPGLSCQERLTHEKWRG